MILAGDIGGTKTTLALYRSDDPIKAPYRMETFASGAHDGLETIIQTFLAGEDVAGEDRVPDRACFGVAGPVIAHRTASITNLPWLIDAARIEERFGFAHCALLNDLEATAMAVPHLDASDVETLSEGTPTPGGTIAVIAPGTGLGIAFLVWAEGRYHACATEGGHASFAPATADQAALLAFLAKRFGHVSIERICSGSGVPNIHAFLRAQGRFAEPDWLKAELTAAADPTPVLIEAALAGRAAICTATLDLFVAALGGVLGNIAVMLLPLGGIYLGGGIPPRILSRLRRPDFLEAMRTKGRFSGFCSSLPVRVILDASAAVHGCAWAARAL